MNAILLTAIWGIIMMFGGVFFKSKQTPKYWAIAGLVLIIISNYVELTTGVSFFFGLVLPYDPITLLPFAVFLSPFPILYDFPN